MAAHVKPLKEGVLTCLMCGNEKSVAYKLSFSNVMDNSDTLNLAELANATIKDVV